MGGKNNCVKKLVARFEANQYGENQNQMKKKNDGIDVHGKAPSFPFYPNDYDRDTSVLSLPARGLWLAMLCFMHYAKRRGYLEHPNGTPVAPIELARKGGTSVQAISRLLDEMAHCGIYSRDDQGVIFNRRMARDTAISLARKAAGKLGAEATHGAGKIDEHVKPLPANLPWQKVWQKGLSSSSSSSSPSATPKPPPSGAAAFDAIREIFPMVDAALVDRMVKNCLSMRDDVTDEEIAAAVQACHQPNQRSPGLFLTTVPNYIASRAREPDPDEESRRVIEQQRKVHEDYERKRRSDSASQA